MKREYYKVYKSLGICTCCGKRKAFEGRTLCEECIEKDLMREKSYNKERKKQYNRRKKDLCLAFVICTTCMKRDMSHGKQCLECYNKRKRKYREQQTDSGKIARNLWSSFNLCTICGEPAADNSKLCEKHLHQARDKAAHMRKFIDREKHNWHKVTEAEIKKIKYNIR